jgi:hypothetical protein
MFAKPIVVFAVFMGFFTSLTLTGIITLIRQGYGDQFLGQWTQLWLLAYPVAVVCIVIYRPIANYLTQRFLEISETQSYD